MIESELRIPICEGRRRSVDGIVRINAIKDCPEMEVIGNKVVCKTNPNTNELDIYCPVLPLNKTSITLFDAQKLCEKKLNETIKNDNAVADENEITTEKSDTENDEPVTQSVSATSINHNIQAVSSTGSYRNF